LRDRLPLGQFLHVVEHDIVVPWSKARDPAATNNKAWKSEPIFELKDYTDAYQWMLMRKETLAYEAAYYVPADKETRITIAQIKAFLRKKAQRKWKTFDKFVEEENKMWCVKPNSLNWKLGKCSCPYYAKNYKCKHLTAISATLHLPGCEIPLTAKQIPLGQKRRRGAPSKARQALIRQ
jgi:hypothetical protein